MKVAIVTLFKELKQTFSVVHVVASHIQMLLEADIQVRLVVSEECLGVTKEGIYADERIEWVGICNTFRGEPLVWHNYWNPSITLHETFEEERQMLVAAFIQALQDVKIVMLHDILYLGQYYIHNMALREAREKLLVRRWIAFTHSYPATPPTGVERTKNGRYMAMPDTLYIYPTQSGVSALANQYGVPEALCRVVYNPTPLLERLTDEVQALARKVDLLSPDILVVYPARLTPGKKLEKVAALVGAIKLVGERSVRIVYCDFASRDIDAKVYKQAIRYIGSQYGLEANEIAFTSEQGFEKGLRRESILDLFELANLYICPSQSESFGMSMLEAASKGNFLVINENVSSLKELGKLLGAYPMKWDARGEGCDITQTYEPSEAAYYGKHAKEILKLLLGDQALQTKTMVRKRFGKEWIWKNQIAPLLKIEQ